MKEVDFKDSEKFRAEQHKFWGNSLMIPLGLDILSVLVYAKELVIESLLIEVVLFVAGYLFITNSHNIMVNRDRNYA